MSVPKRIDGTWRKSSYSGSENCVEANLATSTIGVRDSKAPAGELELPAVTWAAFLEQIK